MPKFNFNITYNKIITIYFVIIFIIFISTKIFLPGVTFDKIIVTYPYLNKDNLSIGIILNLFFLSIITPLTEELIFRYPLSKKLNYTKLVFIFLLLASGIASFSIQYLRPNEITRSFLYLFQINFFYYLLLVPIIVLILYNFDKYLKKINKTTILEFAANSLNSIPIFLILTIHSISFIMAHGPIFQNELASNILQLHRFLFSMSVGYLAYKYGTRFPILLHSLNNLVITIIIISDLEFWTARVLYSTYGLIFILILTLIFKEIDRIRTAKPNEIESNLNHF